MLKLNGELEGFTLVRIEDIKYLAGVAHDASINMGLAAHELEEISEYLTKLRKKDQPREPAPLSHIPTSKLMAEARRLAKMRKRHSTRYLCLMAELRDKRGGWVWTRAREIFDADYAKQRQNERDGIKFK
jgi:hypothetical protein